MSPNFNSKFLISGLVTDHRVMKRRQTFSRRQPYGLKQQAGWLMPMAAFIVVVMGLLAAGLSRVSSTTSVGVAQEFITVQTFFAAESGAQLGMNRVFYSGGGSLDRASATAACTALDGQTLNFSAAGLRGCSTTLSCQVQIDTADTTSFYDISSAAQCGASPVYARRTVEVSAFLQ